MSTPTNQTLRAALLELIPCIDSYCDKNGTSVDGNLDDGPEPMQCQFCYQERFPAVDAILATFDTFIESVTEKKPEDWGVGLHQAYQKGWDEHVDKVIEAYKQFRGNEG